MKTDDMGWRKQAFVFGPNAKSGIRIRSSMLQGQIAGVWRSAMALGFRIDNHLQCRDGLRRQVIAHIAVLKWCRVQILQALFARLYISFLAYFF